MRFAQDSDFGCAYSRTMIDRVSSDLWRAATVLLLLISIAAHGLRPVDLDFDLHPAPFSAYDDDIVRASLGPGRVAADLKALRDTVGGKGKLPGQLVAIEAPRSAQPQIASSGRTMWFVASAAQAIRQAPRSAYFARGPPLA